MREFKPALLFALSIQLLALVPQAPAGEFANAVQYSTGIGPVSVAIGDFNRDGKQDLAVATDDEIDQVYTVSILLGNGDGTFQPAVGYATGTTPVSVAVGDFNLDGKPDVVTVNQGSRTVSVLLGNGDGSFQPRLDYGTGGGPQAVAVGDVNGDGKEDLLVADSDFGMKAGAAVSVLLGNGDGTFQQHVDYGTGRDPFSVAVGDVNLDGNLDLVTANKVGNSVSVLLGNGDGTFQIHSDFQTGTGPTSIAVGDFNQDGNLDVVTANGTGTVSVLLGNGDGTFRVHIEYGAGSEPFSVAVGDFNGDTNSDLAVANTLDDTVSVLLGNGDGTFQAQVGYGTGTTPTSVAIGDLNHDGASDLTVANGAFFSNTISVLLNNGGTFITTSSSANPSTLGEAVTFTTTVTASLQGLGTPTGAVTFKVGAKLLGVGNLIGGQAIITTSKLNIGTHKIRAEYSGDTTFNPHKAIAIVQKVVQ